MLPDADAVIGILAHDLPRWHNNVTHSLFAGAGVALAVAVLARTWRPGTAWYWFVLALTSYELHVVMDFFTAGRGVMLFWPLTSHRFISPLLLFYGLQWGEGIVSAQHIWTVLTEAPFAALFVLLPRTRLWKRVFG